MKQYLQAIMSPRGTCANIAYYTDTPNKNYRIYYCGVDTGQRYNKLGNAARRLQRYADDWRKYGSVEHVTKIYATVAEIPRRGSNARKEA
jgi:hypothetical protein